MASSTNYITRTSLTTHVVPTQSPDVVGFYSSGATIATIVCNTGYEFLVSSASGACCAIDGTDCIFEQGCVSTSMISYGTDVSDTLTCPGSQACVSTTLYQRQPSDGWSATMAWCEDPDNATELFRSLVETVLTLVPDDGLTTTADPDTTTTTVNDEIPTVTDTDTTFTTRPTSLGGEGNETGSPDPDIEDDGGSGTNVGAIAGGVVGGVAGLVLIVLAIWFVMRRQKKKNAELREIGGGYVAPEPK